MNYNCVKYNNVLDYANLLHDLTRDKRNRLTDQQPPQKWVAIVTLLFSIPGDAWGEDAPSRKWEIPILSRYSTPSYGTPLSTPPPPPPPPPGRLSRLGPWGINISFQFPPSRGPGVHLINKKKPNKNTPII